jgi:hypothetical protein
MINRDPRCVYVANSVGDADIVANWLGDAGIAAQVMDRSTLGGLDGLTPWSPLGISARGIEVWVLDAGNAGRALQLLEEQRAERAARLDANSDSAPVSAVCEECGEISVFPAKQRGTVQNCPYCESYIDVEDYEYGDDDAEDGEATAD